MARTIFIETTYLVASVLFILGLRSLTRPEKARRGMQMAAAGMVFAIIGTLINHEIVDYHWIVLGIAVGALIGYPLGMWVPMTAMPQQVAISHMFGALAATLVGVAEYYTASGMVGPGRMTALGFETLFGALTITGSLMAAGKLQEVLPGRPLTFRGQNVVNIALFALTVGIFFYLIGHPGNATLFYVMLALSLAIGVCMVLPIGAADMPVVVSLLNSYAGLASVATGFAIGNNVLIIAGALDGGSGFLLSVLMSKAMNRSFGNVLFGAFGTPAAGAAKTSAGLTPIDLSGRRGAATRLRESRRDRPRLRHGGRTVAAPGAGAGGADRGPRRYREVCDSPGGRPDARAHERAAGRSECPVRSALRHGRDQSRVRARRRRARHRRQ